MRRLMVLLALVSGCGDALTASHSMVENGTWVGPYDAYWLAENGTYQRYADPDLIDVGLWWKDADTITIQNWCDGQWTDLPYHVYSTTRLGLGDFIYTRGNLEGSRVLSRNPVLDKVTCSPAAPR